MVTAATYLNPPIQILSREDVDALIVSHRNRLFNQDILLRVNMGDREHRFSKRALYDLIYETLHSALKNGIITPPLSQKEHIGFVDYYRRRHDSYAEESETYMQHIERLLTHVSPHDPRCGQCSIPAMRAMVRELHVTEPLPYLLDYGNSNLTKFSSLGPGQTHHQRRLSPVGTLWRNFTLQALHSTFEALAERDPAAYMMMVALEPEILHSYAFESHFISYKRSGLQETNIGVAWTALFTAGRDLLNPRGMRQTAEMMFDIVRNGRIFGMTFNLLLHNPPIEWKDFEEFLCITLGPVLMNVETCATRHQERHSEEMLQHIAMVEDLLRREAAFDDAPDYLSTPEGIHAHAVMLCTMSAPDGRGVIIEEDGQQFMTRPIDATVDAMGEYVMEVLRAYARETGTHEVIRGFDLGPDQESGSQPGEAALKHAILFALNEARQDVGRYDYAHVFPKEVRPYRSHLDDAARALGRLASGVLEALHLPSGQSGGRSV
ncbi:MAG: hypothetical protein J0L97_03615 [Alphaproteobacteria bacterium]|nr:hypothetical protein [Alphaproteobacteria bacterium]